MRIFDFENCRKPIRMIWQSFFKWDSGHLGTFAPGPGDLVHRKGSGDLQVHGIPGVAGLLLGPRKSNKAAGAYPVGVALPVRWA